MPSKNPLYPTWHSMLRRCKRPQKREASKYKDRGIVVCDRWLSLDLFCQDMGPRPDGMQLDRIDNNGPYSPDNCRWATPTDNANNTRQNTAILMFGRCMNHNQWARFLGIKRSTFNRVIHSGSNPEGSILGWLGIYKG